jgi:hypothetical protein
VYTIMRVAYPGAFLGDVRRRRVRGAPPAACRRRAASFLAAKALKWWAIVSLGPFWTFRVIVVPARRWCAAAVPMAAASELCRRVGELAGVALMTGAACPDGRNRDVRRAVIAASRRKSERCDTAGPAEPVAASKPAAASL